MNDTDPREFGAAIGELVTIMLADGRTFRAFVSDVRLSRDLSGIMECRAEIAIMKPDARANA